MAADFDHPVDDQHESKLKVILKLDDGLELPDHIKAAYWKFKRPADRISYPLDDGDLIRIALEAEGSTPEQAPYSFFNVLKEQEVHVDSPVEVKWRFGKWVPGRYKGNNGVEILVILDDDENAEDRMLSSDRVRLPE